MRLKDGQAELIYDYAERAFLAVLGGCIITRFLPSLAERPGDGILLVSELAAVVMILVRRHTRMVDMSPYAVTIALVGTTGSLLAKPGGDPLIPVWIGAAAMLLGTLWNIAAKISLNRSFGVAAANRGVKRQGPYRFMRHPMYAGYIVTQAAFLLVNPSAWNLAIYAVTWTAQLLRIAQEEKMLTQDEAYRDYARAVPFRLAPGVY